MIATENKDNLLAPLYGLRNEFLIIGLTGRLGSGCSTVADLLVKNSFDDCEFPKPTCSNSTSNEERKYKIVYNYLKANWKPYTLIRASDVIIALVLKEGLEKFKKFLKDTYPDRESEANEIVANTEEEFNRLSIRVQNLFTVSNDFNGTDENEEIYALFFETEEIKAFNDRLKNEFIRLKITNGSSPFQHFGDNLRKTGLPFDFADERFAPKNCYILSNLIRQLIKLIRKKTKQRKKEQE